MPNLSLFDAKFEKINGKEALQNISAPQYKFMLHIPLNTGFNHNIHFQKGLEIKIQEKKAPN